jgi:hypothetical protein
MAGFNLQKPFKGLYAVFKSSNRERLIKYSHLVKIKDELYL